MDKMDELLHALPRHLPARELAGRIQNTIHRRHRRRQAFRWTASGLLALVGLWLVSPAVAWLTTGEIYSPGMPWLLNGADYLNLESLQMLDRLWNGMFTLQSFIGSSSLISFWLGACLLCLAMTFMLDWKVFQAAPQPGKKIPDKPAGLAPSVQI